mgnify:FL=1
MKDIVFVGHLGLGDHIITQGIINLLAPKYKNIWIPVKQHNISSVAHMCRDLKNISYIPCSTDEDLDHLVFSGDFKEILCVGHRNPTWHQRDTVNFDKYFYRQINIDFNESYNWIPQDGLECEKINKLIPDEPFCFVHDDESRNYKINPNTNLKQIRNSVTADTIFDYLPLIRQATEIHCMDSCFALMIERAGIDCKKYMYSNLRTSEVLATYKNGWEFV